MKLETMSRGSAAQYVVDSIGKEIQRGSIHSGDRLPGENELAERLGVGRSSVREGISRLAAYGIVEVKHGQGTFVTDNLIENIAKIVCYLPIFENLESMLLVREILETGCMKLVFDQFSEADCNELERLSNFLSMENEMEVRVKADSQFHNMIIQKSDNLLLMRIYEAIGSMISYLMDSLMDYPDVVEKAYESHKKIAEGIRKKNALEAVDAMEEHLITVCAFAKKYILRQ